MKSIKKLTLATRIKSRQWKMMQISGLLKKEEIVCLILMGLIPLPFKRRIFIMNKFICALIMMFQFGCKNGEERNKNLSGYTIFEEKIKASENKTFLEGYISNYVDSLNNVSEESELPYFLNDPQFDFSHRGVWETLHSPISVRNQIISRINNCKTLQLIINSSNLNYQKKPTSEENLNPPHSDKSFYDLVKIRFTSLECK